MYTYICTLLYVRKLPFTAIYTRTLKNSYNLFLCVIGLTGNALDSDVSYFLSCGANEVMAKPFECQKFQQIMTKYYESQSQ
jgi:CheY-like chemotaxis protein